MWTPPFLYPLPASVYLSAMSVLTLFALVNLGLSELRGHHLAYSKFWHAMSGASGGGRGGGARLSSRVGMLVIYASALVTSSYLLGTVHMIYALYLSRGLPDPSIDLLYPGVVVFAIGIAGNFYHHCLLSRLRAGSGGGDKGYKIPKGGLFQFVTCPHYLFEIIVFFGFAMISQTVFGLIFASGTAAYLVGRSCATRRWYESKFDEFPAKIKALVPFIF